MNVMRTKTNIFFLPFAGGSKHSFMRFTKHTSDSINVIPVELSGRGTRYKDRLLLDMHKITDDVFEQIAGKLNEPYCMYGHSMGTLIGFLLIKKIIDKKLSPPIHLFVSGGGAPWVKHTDSCTYVLPRDEFFQKIRELGGSPDEVLADDALMDFFEPILRADFQAIETYEHKESAPFNIPVTVMIGTKDKITYEEALEWQKTTTSKIEIIEYAGKHFFIFDHDQKIMKTICNTIKEYSVAL